MKLAWVSTCLLCAVVRAETVSSLEEMVVTASIEKEDTEKGSQSKVSAADLLARGSVSLPDALQREPGVSVPFDTAGVDPLVPFLQGGSKSINIRGLDGNRISVLVDGIRQPEDFTSRTFQGAGGPGRIYFDPAVFSQLDLFKSAAFAPDALGGAVSGQTESPFSLLGPELEGQVLNNNTTYASSNRSWNDRLAAAWGNGDFATSIVYSYRNGHEQENEGDLRANPADFESHAIVWKGVLQNDQWTFEPTVDYFRSTGFTALDSIEVNSPLIGEVTDANNDSERERFRLSLDATYRSEVSLLFDELRAKAYYQSSELRNLNVQTIRDLRDRTNDIFYQTNIAGLNLSATKGVQQGDWSHSLGYSFQVSRSDVTSALLRTDNDHATENRPNLAPSIAWRSNLTLRDEISYGSWMFTPSIRLEHYQVSPDNTAEFLNETTFGFFNPITMRFEQRTVAAADYENFAFSPMLSLSYQLAENWELYGGYARGVRNPSAEELNGVFVHPDSVSINLPNPDLSEENSHSFELGARFRGERTSLHLSTYYNRYQDFIEGNIPTGEVLDGLEVFQTANVGGAEIYGFEVKSDWQIDDQWSLGGAFAWSRGTSEEGPLNSVEPWKAVSYLSYQAPSENWGLELAGTYVDGKSASDITGDLNSTEAYLLLDLTGYYDVTDHFRVRGGLKNLLNEEYVLWSRSNRGSGHAGGGVNSRDTQPGLNGFFSLELEF